MKKIYYFSNIPPHYNRSLWEMLVGSNHFEIHFFFGDNNKSGIKLIDFTTQFWLKNKARLHKIKNYWIGGRILFWQHGTISRCLYDKIDIVIFLGNFYVISNWLAVVICKLRGIRVVFWGHGIYGNEFAFKLFLRKTFYRLADQHLLYERRAKKIMIEHGFDANNLYIIFNSLDYDQHKELRNKYQMLKKTEIYPFFENTELPILVFIGRLTKVKKIDMLLNAVYVLNSTERKVNLIIIGDGNERNNLEVIGKKGMDEKYIYFYGECYSEEKIGQLLYCSDLCVSPGNIGLTAVHSLSFGTPISTHGNLNNQGPEAEIIDDGINGFYFKENDLYDLVEKIRFWLLKKQDREIIRNQCYEMIDKYYNPRHQFTVFKKLVDQTIP